MFVASLPLLASLLANPFNLDGTVVAEGRAGSSPVLVGQAPQKFAAAIITPQVEGWLRENRVDLRLIYLPRFTWQSPNALGYGARPLILHQGSLLATARPSSTTDLAARASASIGDPDYSILPQLLGPGQAALPQIQTILTVSGGAGVQQALSRRWRATLTADASHFQVLNAIVGPGGTPTAPSLPSQTAVEVIPGATFAVTREDEVSLTAATSDGTYSNGVEIFSVAPMLTWRARFPANDELRVGAGVGYARDLGSRPAISGGSALLPTGSVDVLHTLLEQDDVGLTARFRVTVEQHVDPVLATSGPRAFAAGQILLTMAPAWSFAVQANAAASLRRTPLVGDPDETTFSIKVPVRHRISNALLIEGGGQWADRAPAFASAQFAFHQREVWAYVALTATTRDLPIVSGR